MSCGSHRGPWRGADSVTRRRATPEAYACKLRLNGTPCGPPCRLAESTPVESRDAEPAIVHSRSMAQSLDCYAQPAAQGHLHKQQRKALGSQHHTIAGK
eukprot:5396942-Pleurochrysis_carterae.AAC.2